MSQDQQVSTRSGPDVSDLLLDLEAERASLREVLEAAGPDCLTLPTSSPSWTVRDQIAHLAFYDMMAVLAVTDASRFEREERAAAARDISRYELTHLSRVPTQWATLLDMWACSASALADAAPLVVGGIRVPWYGPPMSVRSFITARIMETWAHGQDVCDALAVRPSPTDRLRHVALLAVRARGYSYLARGLTPCEIPVRVDLTGPTGDHWMYGEPTATDVVRGPAEDFCLVLTRRRHVDDTAIETTGQASREWMQIGQAFAGPPGVDPSRTAAARVPSATAEV